MLFSQKNKDQLSKILQATKRKFGHGSVSDWKNKDFENLSFEILQQTKVLISPATLKRLFGKVKTAHTYSPQETTIETLKKYSGYDKREVVPVRSKKYGILILLSGVVLILALLYLVYNSNIKKSTSIKDCSLTLLKLEGQGPATAFFKYSAPLSEDSIFLDYGDGTQWTPIGGTNRTRSHFYGVPGLMSAMIRTLDQHLTPSTDVFIPTKGWQVLAYYFDKKWIERYYPVPLTSNSKEGIFHTTRTKLATMGLDSTKIIVVQLDNYQETNKPGDSFTLQSRFKNSTFWPGIRCYSVYLNVQGTNGKIMFKFLGDGCSGYGEFITGEKTGDGSSTDLTPFAVGLNDWLRVEIRNDHKNVKVLINNAVAFSGSYENSIGNILGTSIKFHGSGSVDYIYLKDSDGQMLFEENF
jgi:hypothetical protein